jgi:hypothetical protein
MQRSKNPAEERHNFAAQGQEWWNVSQVLDWLGRATSVSDEKSALAEVTRKIAAKEVHALFRHCAWGDGQMVARGQLELLPGDAVGGFEFKRAPDGEWVLVPWGRNPFALEHAPTPAGPAAGQLPTGTAAAAYAYDEASAGFVEVSVNAIRGGCCIRFRLDEVMVAWPDAESVPGSSELKELANAKKSDHPEPQPLDADDTERGPGRPPGAYYQPFCDWLEPLYIGEFLLLDAPIDPMIPTIQAKWKEHCEATDVPSASRELPGDRQLRKVIGKVRDRARELLPKQGDWH